MAKVGDVHVGVTLADPVIKFTALDAAVELAKIGNEYNVDLVIDDAKKIEAYLTGGDESGD
jgi:hypothetical protein